MARSKSVKPVRKVTAGAAAGAATVVIVWALKQFWGADVPAPVATALTTVLTFVVSYMTPPAAEDGVTD